LSENQLYLGWYSCKLYLTACGPKGLSLHLGWCPGNVTAFENLKSCTSATILGTVGGALCYVIELTWLPCLYLPKHQRDVLTMTQISFCF